MYYLNTAASRSYETSPPFFVMAAIKKWRKPTILLNPKQKYLVSPEEIFGLKTLRKNDRGKVLGKFAQAVPLVPGIMQPLREERVVSHISDKIKTSDMRYDYGS